MQGRAIKPDPDEARRAAEAAARLAYGRLIALLASRSGDIAAAEDALADAFAAALSRWPLDGVPDNPDAWLFVAARRRLGHARSRAATATGGEATLMLIDAERSAEEPVPFGDERLKLMFVCAHPAIAAEVQAPLMLQTVLGLDAARIASAFLVSPAAMGRQLSRAKQRIRDSGIAFAVPEGPDVVGRVAAVLDAIYAAYGTGWDEVPGAEGKLKDLTGEAIWLGRLVAELLPDNPEAMGLLALMLYCEARRSARRDADGAFVPLDRQDARLWSAPMIVEAERLIRAAALHRTPGRYQTEAAIQSLHAQSRMLADDLRDPLMRLYDLLVTLTASRGAGVARAAAYAEGGRVQASLAQLDALDGCATYQPWWVARARALWLSGNTFDARAAATTAAGLSDDPAVRAFLLSGGLFASDREPSA